MPLPPRAFWTAMEATVRLNCTHGHLIQLAHQGHFRVMLPVSHARDDNDERIAGLFQLAPTDLMPLANVGPCGVHYVHRVILAGGEDGLECFWIAQPSTGLPVTFHDLLISDEELAHFEATHGIGGARYVTPPMTAPKYNWEAFYAELTRRVHEQGVPETQRKLAEDMQQWFIDLTPDADAPDLRTITKKLTPIWRALQQGS